MNLSRYKTHLPSQHFVPFPKMHHSITIAILFSFSFLLLLSSAKPKCNDFWEGICYGFEVCNSTQWWENWGHPELMKKNVNNLYLIILFFGVLATYIHNIKIKMCFFCIFSTSFLAKNVSKSPNKLLTVSEIYFLIQGKVGHQRLRWLLLRAWTMHWNRWGKIYA